MLRKTTKSGEDQYLALLNIRNAPTQGVDSSPVQRLMSRRTGTLLPTTKSLLEPRNPLNPHEMEQLQLNQKRQAKYYNRTAHSLRSWRDFARQCFWSGSEAVNASGDAVGGLVKSLVEFTRGFAARKFPRGLCPRGNMAALENLTALQPTRLCQRTSHCAKC